VMVWSCGANTPFGFAQGRLCPPPLTLILWLLREKQTSQFTQKVRNLRVSPVDGADKLAAHHSTAVDDVCLRPPERPI
jgi:hypothetical protein